MRTKIPVAITGIACIAATVIFSLPAAATTQSATTAAPSKVHHLALSAPYSSYLVRAGESVDFTGPCGPTLKLGQVLEFVGANFLVGFHYHENSCGPGQMRPDWSGIINKGTPDGNYAVHYEGSGGDFGAYVAIVGGVPSVTTPSQPTSQPTSPPPTSLPPTTAPTHSTPPAQQVPVKPKGAPQTGGGGMADVVSTWS